MKFSEYFEVQQLVGQRKDEMWSRSTELGGVGDIPIVQLTLQSPALQGPQTSHCQVSVSQNRTFSPS